MVQFLPNQKLQKMGILYGAIIYIHLMVFCLENCPKLLKGIIRGQRLRICKNFEITRTIYSNSERSEQLLVTVCVFNLFLEVSHVSKIRTIIIQNGKKYWELEKCRKS